MPKKVPGYLFLRTDGHRNFGDPYARNAVFYTPHIQITKDIYKNKKNYQSQALCEIIIATIYKKNRSQDQATGRTATLHQKTNEAVPPRSTKLSDKR